MAQDEPQYNQAFYDAIIAERRKLGNVGYVDIAECMRLVGRTFDNSPREVDQQTGENERA